MWEIDIRETQERYRKRMEKFGYDPQTLGWNKGCQYVRFQAAVEDLRLDQCASILDVGCGFGDLLTFLREQDWAGSYTGIDIVPELIEEAGRRHSSDSLAQFTTADLAAAPTASADTVICIGLLNHKLHQDNASFTENMLDLMWRACKQIVVCDFLSTTAEPGKRQDQLHYTDPAEILRVAHRYSRRVMIHHAYMPFEFIVKIWRDDAFTVSTPVFGPYAYLAPRLRSV